MLSFSGPSTVLKTGHAYMFLKHFQPFRRSLQFKPSILQLGYDITNPNHTARTGGCCSGKAGGEVANGGQANKQGAPGQMPFAPHHVWLQHLKQQHQAQAAAQQHKQAQAAMHEVTQVWHLISVFGDSSLLHNTIYMLITHAGMFSRVGSLLHWGSVKVLQHYRILQLH